MTHTGYSKSSQPFPCSFDGGADLTTPLQWESRHLSSVHATVPRQPPQVQGLEVPTSTLGSMTRNRRHTCGAPTVLACTSPGPGAHLPFLASRSAPPLPSSCSQQGWASPRFFKASAALWSPSSPVRGVFSWTSLSPVSLHLGPSSSAPPRPANCRPIMLLLWLKLRWSARAAYLHLLQTACSFLQPQNLGLVTATWFSGWFYLAQISLLGSYNSLSLLAQDMAKQRLFLFFASFFIYYLMVSFPACLSLSSTVVCSFSTLTGVILQYFQSPGSHIHSHLCQLAQRFPYPCGNTTLSCSLSSLL